MITTNDINEILGIKESFQLHDVLSNILFDEVKKKEVFEKFLDIENDLSYDWFTNYFQEEQSNRKTLKQDYTPDCICKIISRLQNQSNIILDECAGIGGLTISTWNKDKNKTFYCEELSDNSIMMLLFNLSIRNIKAYVRHGDVLRNEFKAVYELTPCERFSDIKIVNQENDYYIDTVISNPPYSLKFEDVDFYVNDPRYAYFGMPPKTKADYGFILHALSHLKTDGEAYFIMPHGVLFRGGKEYEIRKKIIESNLLDAVIGLPEKLFLNTQIPVCIMLFKTNRKNKDVLFIDGSRLFQKCGKQNEMTNEHIDKILSACKLRSDIDKLSHVATFNEIRDNDFNLNIPRYVDTFVQKESIDIKKNIEQIKKLENEICGIEDDLKKMFQELSGSTEYENYRDSIVEHIESKDKHTVSNIFQMVNSSFEKKNNIFYKQKEVNFYDIATFERSKKNKIYPSNSILIQLSATRGQIEFLDHNDNVEQKFGVIKTDMINPKYLFYILEMIWSDFLNKYQTGLNINPEILNHLKLTIHTSPEAQDMIVYMMDSLDKTIKNQEKYIDEWKDVKQVHLDGMFI